MIWKYNLLDLDEPKSLPSVPPGGRIQILMPEGSSVISLAKQKRAINIYALVNPNQQHKIVYNFAIAGTGINHIPEIVKSQWRCMGTFVFTVEGRELVANPAMYNPRGSVDNVAIHVFYDTTEEYLYAARNS